MKIVSLVPSLTEFLFDIGVGECVVGVTWFCIHPKAQTKLLTKIGGTKNLKIDTIKALAPDLVIANKEENIKEQIEEIERFAPVLVTDISNISQALIALQDIGLAVGKQVESKLIIQQIEQCLLDIKGMFSPQKVLYLIWREPFMAAGIDTFINSVLDWIGWEGAVKQTRYPSLTVEDIHNHAPDLILLSSEPYPFKDKHIQELKAILPLAKIILVDGEMFSWYGSRMLQLNNYLRKFGRENNLL